MTTVLTDQQAKRIAVGNKIGSSGWSPVLSRHFGKKGGRPRQCTNDELLKKITAYIMRYENGDTSGIPTMEELAISLSMTKAGLLKRIRNADDQRLVNAIDYLMTVQAARLINGGISGKMNPSLCAFLLNVNHGMVAKKNTQMV